MKANHTILPRTLPVPAADPTAAFQAKVRDLLSDQKKLCKLLGAEKARRGVDRDALVFVGMAEVAKHWWCTQEGVLKARGKEIQLFRNYLADRLTYAQRLGLISKLPRRHADLLAVGEEIALADIDRILQEDEARRQAKAAETPGGQVTWIDEQSTDPDGMRTILINPDLPPEQRRMREQWAKDDGMRVIDLEEHPTLRGQLYEQSRAERYPTIRWHFPWGRYCVGGVPDGLTESFVYEFKTVGTSFLVPFRKPVARAQADLYGMFFNRPNKRVQLHIVEENHTETYEGPIDQDNARATLEAFARVDAGEPPRLPVRWKCKKCDVQTACPFRQD